MEKRRWDTRMDVVFDHSISAAARLFYVYLDDCAGNRGTAWPGQQKVVDLFGVDVRTVRRWYAELAGRGYLATLRKQQATATQALSWTGQVERTKMSAGRTKMSGQADKNVRFHLIEPDIEPVGPCACEGTGYNPPGTGKPCRDCITGWQLSNTARTA